MPTQAAVARETSRFLYKLAGKNLEEFDWDPKLAVFPHPQLRGIGMAGYVLGPFIFAACMFGLVIQVGTLDQAPRGHLRRQLTPETGCEGFCTLS